MKELLSVLASALLLGVLLIGVAFADEMKHDMGRMDSSQASCHDTDNMEGATHALNPGFGPDIYHTHTAGMWMFGYKFMHMSMDGLMDGDSGVALDEAGFMRDKRHEYMMIPTGMTMDMRMMMVMYGLTDRMTLMAGTAYRENRMRMMMDMGPGMGTDMGKVREDPMETSGLGDTELRGIYKVSRHLTASLGLSLPTGSIEEKVTIMGMLVRAPYDMQLGSGTLDVIPAVTYSDLSKDGKWNWGAQAGYTWHAGKNSNGWSYGDTLKVDSWVERALGPASSWLRLAYSNSGEIRGEDEQISGLLDPVTGAPTPDADTSNYGGQSLNAALGIGYRMGAFSLGLEGGLPLYQYMEGLQLKNDWFLSIGVQAMF